MLNHNRFMDFASYENGKWKYLRRSADYWFLRAKSLKSVDHFFIASTLSAMETWDIIGLEEK